MAQVSVSFQKNMAVLGSSLFISHPDTCSWVSLLNVDQEFNDTFLYDWPIWKHGCVMYIDTLLYADSPIIYFFEMCDLCIHMYGRSVSFSHATLQLIK